jgi:hypothetical protein
MSGFASPIPFSHRRESDSSEPLPSPPNSRAVLAALRSLQAKIHQLETERDAHLGRCEALRTQLELQQAYCEAQLAHEQAIREAAERQSQATIARLEAEVAQWRHGHPEVQQQHQWLQRDLTACQKEKKQLEITVLALMKETEELQAKDGCHARPRQKAPKPPDDHRQRTASPAVRSRSRRTRGPSGSAPLVSRARKIKPPVNTDEQLSSSLLKGSDHQKIICSGRTSGSPAINSFNCRGALNVLIDELEAEDAALHRHYLDLLRRAHASSTAEEWSDTLGLLIATMSAKGEQIRQARKIAMSSMTTASAFG